MHTALEGRKELGFHSLKLLL
jgi:hypothetical protein